MLIKKFMLALIVLFTTLNFSAYASTKDKAYNEYFELYKDDEIWKIDVYRVEQNKLQIKSRTIRFQDERTARNQYKNLMSKVALNLADKSLVSTEVNDSLWTVENSWNGEWESRYHKWVKENLHEKYFLDHKLDTDCADAAVALRWIFARENKLPAGNQLAGSNVLFTQDSIKSAWQNLPRHQNWWQDQKFLAALNYVLNNTYTRSIAFDSLPIAIKESTFQPGIFHLYSSSQGMGHTRIVAEANYNQADKVPIVLLYSTVPREVRPLAREILLYLDAPYESLNGFRSMRWPVKSGSKWTLLPADKHPHYSLEQFDEKFQGEEKSYYNAFLKKLGLTFNATLITKAAINELIELIISRVEIVKQGHQLCLTQNCEPPSENWENWSTPSRDKRISDKFSAIQSLVNDLSGIEPELQTFWDQTLTQTRVDILHGRMHNENDESHADVATLELLKFIFNFKFYSYDPRHTPQQRWGVRPNYAALNLLNDLNEAIRLRKLKVPNVSPVKACIQHCAIHSTEYNKFQSAAEDDTIQKLFLKFMRYCDLSKMSAPNCELFNNEFDNFSFDLFGNPITARDFLSEQVLFLNIDPNIDNKARWGLNRQARAKAFKQNETFVISKSGITLDQNNLLLDQNGQSLNINEKRVRAQTLYDDIVFLILTKEVNSNFRAAIYNEIRQSWLTIQFKPTQNFSEHARLQFLGQHSFALIENSNIEIFKIHDQAATPIASGHASPYGVSIEYYLPFLSNGQLKLAYEINNEIKIINLADMESLSSISPLSAIHDEWLLYSQDKFNENIPYSEVTFINLKSEKVYRTLFSPHHRVVMFSPDLKYALTQSSTESNVHINQLNEQKEIIATQFLGSGHAGNLDAFAFSTPYLLASRYFYFYDNVANLYSYYRFDNDKLTKRENTSPLESLNDFLNGQFAFLQYNPSSAVVTDFANSFRIELRHAEGINFSTSAQTNTHAGRQQTYIAATYQTSNEYYFKHYMSLNKEQNSIEAPFMTWHMHGFSYSADQNTLPSYFDIDYFKKNMIKRGMIIELGAGVQAWVDM